MSANKGKLCALASDHAMWLRSLPTSTQATPQPDSLTSVMSDNVQYASMDVKENTDYSIFDHQFNIGNIPEDSPRGSCASGRQNLFLRPVSPPECWT
jgi:hypothetical protein